MEPVCNVCAEVIEKGKAATIPPGPENCPRWRSCSVNCCPLDPAAMRRRPVPGDPETVCKAHLRDRLEITAAAFREGVTLPWGGKTEAEARSGKTVKVLLAEWDAKEAVRQERLKIMRSQRVSREKQGGLAPAPSLGTSG